MDHWNRNLKKTMTKNSRTSDIRIWYLGSLVTSRDTEITVRGSSLAPLDATCRRIRLSTMKLMYDEAALNRNHANLFLHTLFESPCFCKSVHSVRTFFRYDPWQQHSLGQLQQTSQDEKSAWDPIEDILILEDVCRPSSIY